MISVALEEVQRGRSGASPTEGLDPSLQYTTQSVHFYLPPFQYIWLSSFNLCFSRLIFPHYLQPCCVLWSTLILYFPLCIPMIISPSLPISSLCCLPGNLILVLQIKTKQSERRGTGVTKGQKRFFFFKLINGGKSLCGKQNNNMVERMRMEALPFLDTATEMKQEFWEAQGIGRAAGLLPAGICCVPGL